MSRGTVDGKLEALLVSKSTIWMPIGKDIFHLDTVDGWGPAVKGVPLCHHLPQMTQPFGRKLIVVVQHHAWKDPFTAISRDIHGLCQTNLAVFFQVGSCLVMTRGRNWKLPLHVFISSSWVEVWHERHTLCWKAIQKNKIFKLSEIYKTTFRFYLLRNELKVLLGLYCLIKISGANLTLLCWYAISWSTISHS